MTPTEPGQSPTSMATPTEGTPFPTPSPTPTRPDGWVDAAFIAFPNSGLAPLTVRFEDRSRAGHEVTEWSWDVGDGGAYDTQSVTHTFETPGVYTVSLTAFDGQGNEATSTREGLVVVLDDPGGVPTALDADVVINELLSSGSYDDNFVEIHNESDHTIDLSGLWLSDDEEDPARYIIPQGAHVAAGGFYLLYEALSFGEPSSSSPFSLVWEGGDILLAAPPIGEGGVVDVLADEGFGPVWGDVSLGRVDRSDGESNFVAMIALTPGAANTAPRVGPVIISELYYNPASGDQDEEFIELYNTADHAVLMEVDGSPYGFGDGIDFFVPQGFTMGAGERVVVAKSPARFNIIFPDVTARVLGPYGGQLSNSGERVELSVPVGVDGEGEVRYSQIDRLTYEDGGDWPSEADGGGYALSRVDPQAYGDDPAQWEAREASPGEAAAEPAPPANLLISEIYYHPPTELDADEWIELYNGGSEPVDLAGWRLVDGVSLTLPSAVIDAGSYAVIAADVAVFAENYGDVGVPVLGGWSGRLSNRGETLTLVDAAGVVVQSMTYSDQGDWAERAVGPVLRGHTGWVWDAPHDGGGASLERRSLLMSNDHGRNWGPSEAVGGSPGAVNSLNAVDIAPLISRVRLEPEIPSSADAVVVTARLRDEAESGLSAELMWRLDETDTFQAVPMADDGLSGDGDAGDGIFGASIPPAADGAVVELYVRATDAEGAVRTFPAATQPSGQQLTNLLYQVDDTFSVELTTAEGTLPYHYLIMTEAERAELEDIGNGVDEDPEVTAEHYSDAQMNGTFISVYDGEVEITYQVGIRNRGSSSRGQPPNNYRVNFPHDRPWHDLAALNVNAVRANCRVAGTQIYKLAGMVSEDVEAVRLRVNGADLAVEGYQMFGAYASVEATNSDFVNNHYPDDNDGNLYRAKVQADFTYLGDDPDAYREWYVKDTNDELDDFSDIMALTYMLENEPEASLIEAMEAQAHLDEWLRWMAVDTLIGNLEGGLNTGKGDDYSLYRGVLDPRFHLLPHDMDTILGQGPSPQYDKRIDFYAEVEGLGRLLTQPEVISRYHDAILEVIQDTYRPDIINPLFDELFAHWVGPYRLDLMKEFVVVRTGRVLEQMFSTTLIAKGATWRYLEDGLEAGAGYAEVAYDDGSWPLGAAPLGYGDSGLATEIGYGGDATNKPITALFRHRFEVADPAAFDTVTLRFYRDDGAVVYLNGVEVGRSNLPEGPITLDTRSPTSSNGVEETNQRDLIADGSLLVVGTNVVTVEVHQVGPASDDMRFELWALGNPAPEVIWGDEAPPVEWPIYSITEGAMGQ